jgi:hypothetical protein
VGCFINSLNTTSGPGARLVRVKSSLEKGDLGGVQALKKSPLTHLC